MDEQYVAEVSNRYGHLWDDAEDEGLGRNWRLLQGALLSAAEDIIRNKRKSGRKAWMTDENLKLKEERRQVKNTSVDWIEISKV